MKIFKLSLLVLGLSLGVSPAFTQNIDSELAGEVDALYDELPEAPKPRRVRRARRVIQAPQVVSQDIQVQKIYVPSESVEEVRPTLTVEAAPLRESKASRLRKKREAIESQTELRIVEKLEEDRMRAEEERASRIFGDKLERQKQDPIYKRSAEQELDYQELRQDIKEMVNELREPRHVVPVVNSHEVYEVEDYQAKPAYRKFYMGGAIGTGSYPGTDNISGVFSLAISGGYQFDSRLSAEVSYNFSSYDVEDPYSSSGYYPNNYGSPYQSFGYAYSQPIITEMDQHSIGLGVMYKFMPNSKIRPLVGLVGAYTMRKYSESVYSGFQQAQYRTDSDAFDLGLQGGADIHLSKRFSVGLDLRYMFNLTNNVRRQQQQNPWSHNYTYNSNGVEAIEELDYFLFNLNAKFSF